MAPPVSRVPEPQSTGAVLMLRPAGFGFNPETADSNAFQTAAVDPRAAHPAAQDHATALEEFDRMADSLERAGVDVIVAHDTASPLKPDAVFPNNWVSFHGDGTAVLYPMLAPNRRLERRMEPLDAVSRGGYRIERTVDMSRWEAQGQFLEGTGSMVLDRRHRIAYAGLSPRTHLEVLREFARRLEYEVSAFDALDAQARPIYHTNVLLAVGTHFAVICGEAITDSQQRAAVFERLRGTGHELIEISAHQLARFAGNVLELATPRGPMVVMSGTAWESFDSSQRQRLECHGSVLAVDIPVIERRGGGGVRCMLAEIHLPKRAQRL